MRISLLFENCLFAQLVIDAIVHDNKTIVEIFLCLDKKWAHYKKENDADRTANAKLLSRMRAYILENNVDTEGYAWSVEELDKVHTREQLLHLTCKKASRYEHNLYLGFFLNIL